MALLEAREELSPDQQRSKRLLGVAILHRKGRRGQLLVSRRWTPRTSFCGLEVTEEDHSAQACTQARSRLPLF